jgi:hypothetical protein
VSSSNKAFESSEQDLEQAAKSNQPDSKSGRKSKAEQQQDSIEQQLQELIEIGKTLDNMVADGNKAMTVRDQQMKNLLQIRDKSGCKAPFVPNEAQRLIAERWGKKNIILKARQLGMTTYVAARFFIETITRPGTLTVMVAHDQRSAEDIFRMVHRFQENLPEELRQGALKTSRANVRQLVWPALDSEFRVESAADPNAGRGSTIRNLHCSEVARWTRDGAEALLGLRAAVPPDGQVVMESTPQGSGGTFYEEWEHADETGYVRHFLPWWLEKGYRVPGVGAGELKQDERELMARQGLDEEQIVYRRGLKAQLRRKMQQEFAESPEECFLASGDCVFDVPTVEARLKQMDTLEENMTGGLAEFLPPEPKKRYIIGVDPAGGGSNGDYSCAEVIEVGSGLQCAELHDHLTPPELAVKVAKLAKRYNNAEVAVEKNNQGGEALRHLATVGCENLYPLDKEDKGWCTNVANRPTAVANLVDLVQDASKLFSSPRLLREMKTFVRREDGSPRAMAGTHDDCVMAMAIAQMVRTQG